MAEKRYYNGLVSRFSAGHVDDAQWTKLAQSLKTGLAAGSKVHARGVNMSAGDLHSLVRSLRLRGVEVLSDGPMSAAGTGMVVFSISPMAAESLVALANSVNRAPAGRRVIDCEGYAYLAENIL